MSELPSFVSPIGGGSATSVDVDDTTLVYVGDILTVDQEEVFRQFGDGAPAVSRAYGQTQFGFDPETSQPVELDWENTPRVAFTESATTATVTSATTTSATDSGKSWTTNQWVGYRVRFTSGTQSGFARVITANTATQVSWSSALASAPAVSDTFVIERQGRTIFVGATTPTGPVPGDLWVN